MLIMVRGLTQASSVKFSEKWLGRSVKEKSGWIFRYVSYVQRDLPGLRSYNKEVFANR